MGPLLYMRSVVDRNVVMRRMTVFLYLFRRVQEYGRTAGTRSTIT